MRYTEDHKDHPIDFAVSYAGEDIDVAENIARRIRQHNFRIFLAREQSAALTGENGKEALGFIFRNAKLSIVVISNNYQSKPWPQFEWETIRACKEPNQIVAVKLDSTELTGLPPDIFFIAWETNSPENVARECIGRLLTFEKIKGLPPRSLYNEILSEIANSSRGGVAKSFQLVKDGRERTPLGDAELPRLYEQPRYECVEIKSTGYGAIKRLSMKARLPPGLTREEVVSNLKHCCIVEFNKSKPDAISAIGYSAQAPLEGAGDIAIVEFAPFGDWGRAEEGFAYNIPTTEFDFRIIEIGHYQYKQN